MKKTHAQASVATPAVDLSTALSTRRVSRRPYYQMKIVDAKGKTVPETTWKTKVSEGATGRSLTIQLKKAGLQKVWVLDSAAYEAAKKTFYKTKREERAHLIDEAFTMAGAPHEGHIEKALKDILPLLRGVPAKKALNVLKNVVSDVQRVAAA